MDTFFETHSLHEAGQSIAPATALPEDLRTVLNQVGTGTYANGFFRFVEPQSMRPYLSPFNLQASECYPFLKGAFGHLVFYQNQEYKVLDPVFNSVDTLGGTGDFDFVMDIALCDRGALESTFMIDIYEQVHHSLGAPGLAEMYAFVPALGLGGNRSAGAVKKSQMSVEMPILAQL